MENNEFDERIRENLRKKDPVPRHINQKLMEGNRNKNEFKGLVLIFFILSIIQSLFIISVGIFLVSNIIIKIFILEFGVILLVASIFIYMGIRKERGGLKCEV